LEPFNSETHVGNFRQLTVRVGQATDELMLIVGIHPQNLVDEKLKSFKDSLVEFFTSGDGKELNVDSLYYQTIEKR
jgi:tRNA (uracil-5-)-methyltransferase